MSQFANMAGGAGGMPDISQFAEMMKNQQKGGSDGPTVDEVD